MKKRTIITVLTCLMLLSCLLLLMGCDESLSSGNTTTDKTIISGPGYVGDGAFEQLPTDNGPQEYAGVRKGMTYEEVVALLGEEPPTVPLGQPGEKCWVLEDGTRLYLTFQTRLYVNSTEGETRSETIVLRIRVETES